MNLFEPRCISDFVGGNISIIYLVVISYHRLQCIRDPYGNKKISLKDSLKPSMIIWPLVFIFWALPIILIIKNYELTKNYMNFKHCYFMYTFEYVIIVDLVAYVLPAIMVIILQVLIYSSLKNKNKLVGPILNKLNYRYGHNSVYYQTNSKYKLPTKSLVLNSPKKNSLVLTSEFSSDFAEVIIQRRKASLDEALMPKLVENVQISYPLKSTISTGSIHSKAHYPVKQDQNLTYMLHSLNQDNNLQKLDKKTKTNHLSLNHLSCTNLTKNRKAFRTLFFVTISLVIFWAPWMVLWPVHTYCKCVPSYLYSIAYWMEYLNSFINSAILIVGNQKFRNKVISICIKFKKLFQFLKSF